MDVGINAQVTFKSLESARLAGTSYRKIPRSYQGESLGVDLKAKFYHLTNFGVIPPGPPPRALAPRDLGDDPRRHFCHH